MSSEKVLELSVEETNKLRADLGLAPLRLESNIINQQDAVVVLPSQHNAGTASSSSEQRQEELLEISVNDTNALRAKLGLSALRQGDSASKKAIVHAPAENESERKQAAERIERAKLQRQVEQGISRFQNQESLGAQEASAKSWAAQMRSQTTAPKPEDTTVEATRRKKPLTKNGRYDETDLHGINVAHAMSELQDGSTTVMTLADGSLLKTADDISKKVVGLNDEDDFALENINLAEQQHQQEGIRQKRKMELGMGRAGGYAGFDDDEFEDLGGSQAPSRFARGGGGTGPNENATTKGKRRGFQIGAHLQDDEDGDEPDLFAAQEGKAISLEPAKADVAASDFMTSTEDEELRQSKKKKKDSKFKKKKKKDKKDKKKQRTAESDDQDEDEQVGTQPTRGLLEELEETAIDSATVRKRNRSIDEVTAGGRQDDTKSIEVGDSKVDEAAKRAKFDSIMAKGNERARDAFHSKNEPIFDLDEEPDDAFLNAALAKARRLNRLREMSGTKKTSGADAIAAAVKSSRVKEGESKPSGTVAFAVDETREFTRALLARTEQTEREQARKAIKKEDTNAEDNVLEIDEKPVATTVTTKEEDAEEMDIAELAKEVKEDNVSEDGALDGTTASMIPVGRGLGGVLSMLKQTGEITRKNAGKEEMRGRAKDKRTYEDYEALDLSEVVKIDKRTATDKDKEFASREVKLEYRDKHGRLLTRKEAYRDLSYQFHGHGSGKRREEKRLQQIAREQAESRVASRQASDGANAGMLGALKATQKATGKAFVVHKT